MRDDEKIDIVEGKASKSGVSQSLKIMIQDMTAPTVETSPKAPEYHDQCAVLNFQQGIAFDHWSPDAFIESPQKKKHCTKHIKNT